MAIFGLFGLPDIAKLKARQDVVGLIKALKHKENFPTRAMAADALGELGSREAVEPLVTALVNDEAEWVRRSSAKALGRLGDKRAVESLIAALSDDWAKADAVVALGLIGDVRAVEPLIRTLQTKELTENKRVETRTRAAEALGKIGDTRAVEPLITAFSDQDSDVQLGVLRALAKMGDTRAAPICLSVLQGNDFPANKPSNPQVKYDRRTDSVGSPLAISPIEIVSPRPFSERVYDYITQELAQYKSSEMAQQQAKLKANRPVMRCIAAETLGKLKVGMAVQPLISCLQGSNKQMLVAAIISLGQIGDVQAVHPLLTIDRGDDVEIDSVIIKALVCIGPSGTESLAVALDDENERVQSYAGRALSAIGGTRTVNLLITALEDRAGYVKLSGEAGRAVRLNRRVVAASALGEKRDGHALQPLIRVLQDANPRLRAACASALGLLGDAAAADYLLPCLQDPDPSLRWSSAEALGRLGDKRAIQPLLPLLRDANAGVKTSAVAALTKLGYDVLPLNWPSYTHALTGHNIIRVNNPNPFRVRAGIRCGSWGVDILVPPGSIGECSAPDGKFEVYFQYATEPLSLYRGEQLALAGNGIEITIQKVYGGNYGIRKVD